ncbi:MAG TPA: DUF2332 domain-containing protein [Streptosporangiaceae bacterium]|nr:DUF2332 domain-containing protein [Streptosporangiaceae bacterium]
MSDRAELRRAFAEQIEFARSPLYCVLSQVVAEHERLLDLAGRGRPGQYPTFLFFGAVHELLLGGADHPLAEFYPSVAGASARPSAEAGPALVSFCAAYETELTKIISTRLVQTNHVQRALGLRLGLSTIAAEVPGPADLIEVGASAGLILRFDRYGYRVGGRQYGDPGSPVQLTAEHYGPGPLPDLDVLPQVASVTGVDLNPVDIQDPGARRWLEALVWPENQDQRELLTAALAVVAADPPLIHRGDAIDVLPDLAAALPVGRPRVVFHAATRMHVPAQSLDAFDGAILSVGATGPMWWLSVEDSPEPDPRPAPARPGPVLRLRRPDGFTRTVAVVNGHLRWIETLSG